MMNPICKKCRKPISDGMLACPNCVLRQSQEAMRRFQLAPVLQIGEGHGAFTVHRTSTGNHAQRFSPNGRKGLDLYAFCGAEANAPEKKRSRAAYGSAGYQIICEKCRAAIAEILVEARTAEAMKTT